MAKIIFMVLTMVCFSTSLALAKEEYPTKPIEIIHGASAGGWTDTVQRLLAPLVEKELGVKVIIINKPGASNSLAAKEVLHAAPDGYKLLSVFHHFMIFPAISASSPYSIHDFEPIAKLVDTETVISGNPNSSWKTYDQVIEYARKNPRKLKVATSGIASMGNFMQEIVNRKAKIEYIHMPLKGEIDALTAVLGGHADICFGSLQIAAPHIKSGKLIALASFSTKRPPFISDKPTLVELGYPKAIDFSFSGLVAPKKVAPDRIAKISKAYEKAIMDPEINTNLNKLHLVGNFLPSQEFKKWLVDTFEDVKKIAAEADIKFQ